MRSVTLALALAACSGEPTPPPAPPAPPPVEITAAQLAPFAALPAEMTNDSNPLTEAKINLGRQLYYDTRLSKNHDVSCNTCHLLDQYGVDGQPTSTGHKGQKGGRNAPTVYNAAGHKQGQFWDWRAASIEDQAKGPPLNPIEMAMADAAAVEKTLASIPGYVDAFKAAFPGEEQPVTYDNFAKAVGAFERKLVTPAPWDKFLAGDAAALTEEQKKGFLEFSAAGCTTCHNGPYLGGDLMQKVGVVSPWPNQADGGRFEVTKAETDKMLFKVPSLRNIEKTAPYFHDGQTADLKEAVRLMGRHQLGKELTDEQIASITTFFSALTGPLPTEYIAKPTLPESGPDTPKADPS